MDKTINKYALMKKIGISDNDISIAQIFDSNLKNINTEKYNKTLINPILEKNKIIKNEFNNKNIKEYNNLLKNIK
jgi:hypothetical protein